MVKYGNGEVNKSRVFHSIKKMLIDTVDFYDKTVVVFSLFFPIIGSSVFNFNQRAVSEKKKMEIISLEL